MDVVSKFNELKSNVGEQVHDFVLFKYTEMLFVGIDNKKNCVVICKSNKPGRSSLRQRTKLISIECNMQVNYVVDGREENGKVHIIRCYTTSEKEQEIFIELAPLFDEASIQEDQEEALLETVSILASFFANKIEPSDSELQGLYAELYTIKKYQANLRLSEYWQSRDRMKFDFSISDTLKIEVKSTLKNERKHHFRHDQLAHEMFDIYVVSYMLRHDDAGLSLFELIDITKPLISNDPRRLLILEKYLKNTSELRLRQFRFNEQITEKKRQIYRASDIPRFVEDTPVGVTNAEYDCNLDSAKAIDEEEFFNDVLSQLANSKGGGDLCED